MFFSFNKWNDAAELNQFIPVSSALSFERMESSFRDAEDLFLRPVFGDNLLARLQKLYDEDEEYKDEELLLLRYMQAAEGNLAWWYNFDELNLRITDQGVQRQVTENFTSAYRYQEDTMRSKFKTKGFNAIDTAIDFCMRHIEEFPEFKESSAWAHRRTSLVKGLREAEGIWSISGSSLVWMRLEPIIREVEQTILPSVLGMTCFDALIENLKKDEGVCVDGQPIEYLRVKAARYVTTAALAKMIRRSGEITDRGLYFESVAATSISGNTSKSADRERIIMLAQEIEKTSEVYKQQMVMAVETRFPSLFSGRESAALNRDNDNKSTFFA